MHSCVPYLAHYCTFVVMYVSVCGQALQLQLFVSGISGGKIQQSSHRTA